MQTIYLDVLIGVNIYVNYLLLTLTARFAARPTVHSRMALGALAGALSSCTILLNIPSTVLSILIKVITAVIMTAISFEIKSRRMFLKLILILNAVTFGFAGGMLGIKNIMSTGKITVSNFSVYIDISPIYLILTTLVCYVLLSVFSRLTARKAEQLSTCRLTISNNGKSVTLDALLDTGNTLTEPFSGLPVVVVGEKSIHHLLPDELVKSGVSSPELAGGIRVIPYSSVGGDGLLKGFMPDSVTVESGGKKCSTAGVYVAVSNRRSDIPALINPDILS